MNSSSVTSANATDVYEAAIDPRFNLLENKIPIDASGSYILVSRRAPNSRGGSPHINSSGSPTYFEISSSSDLRNYIGSFALIVKCHCENEAGGGIDHAKVSVPWNPACMISTLQLRINGQGSPLEIDSSTYFMYSNTMRVLCEMSRTNIEGRSDVFWTPCMDSEEDADVSLPGGLSPAAQARTLTWFSSLDNDIIYNQRLLPFAYLFSSCNMAAQVELHKIELFITWRDPTSVCFKTTDDAHTNNFFIDDVNMILNQQQMSVFQNMLETRDIKTGKNAQNLMFAMYDAYSTTYTSSQNIIRNSVVNLDTVFLWFPATILTNGANYLQACSNSISTYNAYYANMPCPTTPVSLSVADKKCNVEIYYEFLRAIDKINNKNFVPSIDYEKGYAAESLANNRDDSTYFIYATKFNNSLQPKLTSASELRIIPIQAPVGGDYDSTNCTAIVIMKRWVQCTINPDGTVNKVYQ